MSKDELIEKLADIEHQRWSDWQRWVHHEAERVLGQDGHTSAHFLLTEGDLIILAQDAQRWEKLIDTPYADLPEHSKQSDRDQVMRYWPMIVDFVAEWLEDRHAKYAAAAWREDMS